MKEQQILVKGLINEFAAEGLEIMSAVSEGYKKPEKVKVHQPDIIGWDPEKELFYLGTIKTQNDDLSSTKTGEQFYELSNLVMSKGRSQGKRLPYYIGVPKDKLPNIKKALVDFGISKRENIYTVGL